MTTTTGSDRFIILRNEQTLASTVTAEEHGFSAEVVDDRDAACDAVLARIPRGSSVMTNNSVTLDEVGSLDAINGGGHYDPVRAKMAELDYATQRQEMKAIAGQPEILEIPSELPDRVHVVRIRGVVVSDEDVSPCGMTSSPAASSPSTRCPADECGGCH